MKTTAIKQQFPDEPPAPCRRKRASGARPAANQVSLAVFQPVNYSFRTYHGQQNRYRSRSQSDQTPARRTPHQTRCRPAPQPRARLAHPQQKEPRQAPAPRLIWPPARHRPRLVCAAGTGCFDCHILPPSGGRIFCALPCDKALHLPTCPPMRVTPCAWQDLRAYASVTRANLRLPTCTT